MRTQNIKQKFGDKKICGSPTAALASVSDVKAKMGLLKRPAEYRNRVGY